MEIRINALLSLLVLLTALGVGNTAGAQQSGTADEAQAMLARAAAAVRVNEAGALASFESPSGGFKDRDLYVFCFDHSSGIVLAGPTIAKGRDVRTLMDPTGKRFGQEMFADVADGRVIVVDYLFPKPNSTTPVPKESFVEELGNIACGVGYYKAFAHAPGGSTRASGEHHACTVIMGLQPPGTLYDACVGVLDSSLSGLDRERAISQQQSVCAQQGLRPGTPSYAACIANGGGF
jgi:hypothetical protein